MQIFNKSKRQFTISTGVLKPEQSTTVSDAEGAKLIDMYKDELIQIGNSVAEKENADLRVFRDRTGAGNGLDDPIATGGFPGVTDEFIQ